MRGRLEPKDTVERFWGLKFIGFPNLSDETPKPISSTLRFPDFQNFPGLNQAEQEIISFHSTQNLGFLLGKLSSCQFPDSPWLCSK